MGHILFTAVVGALSGLFAWLMSEPLMPATFNDPAARWASLVLITLLGAFIAGSVGAVSGYRMGSRRHMLLGLFIGGFAGACGATLGFTVGSGLAHTLFPGFNIGMSARTIPGFVTLITPMGALIGLAIGLPLRSPKQAVLGLIGGSLGGLVAGIAFSPLSHALAGLTSMMQGGDEIGKPGRAAMAIVLGGSIGLFVSLAREVAKKAWIRQRLGRNEGREWVVDAPQTFIGRDERAHVPLFGDDNVAPMHACIVRQGREYVLYDSGTPVGTMLNGQRIQQAMLPGGSVIQIGSHILEFSMRGQSGPAAMIDQPRVAQPVQPVVVSHPALVVTAGPHSGTRVDVIGAVEIGREGSGLRLDRDANASRRHARVEMAPSGLMVTDLGSTNGTFVNGQRITTSALRPGDVLRVGNSDMRVE